MENVLKDLNEEFGKESPLQQYIILVAKFHAAFLTSKTRLRLLLDDEDEDEDEDDDIDSITLDIAGPYQVRKCRGGLHRYLWYPLGQRSCRIYVRLLVCISHSVQTRITSMTKAATKAQSSGLQKRVDFQWNRWGFNYTCCVIQKNEIEQASRLDANVCFFRASTTLYQGERMLSNIFQNRYT